MKLSIDFAFAGFDIIKKHPGAVLLWGVVAMVLGVPIAIGVAVAAVNAIPD